MKWSAGRVTGSLDSGLTSQFTQVRHAYGGDLGPLRSLCLGATSAKPDDSSSGHALLGEKYDGFSPATFCVRVL